jgi:hypothetical protein
MENHTAATKKNEQFYDFFQFVEKQEASTQVFPFKTRISLRPFIERVTLLSQQEEKPESDFAKVVLERIGAFPELTGSELTREALTARPDLLAMIMSVFFNPLFSEQKIGYIVSPFSSRVMYATPDLVQILQSGNYEVSVEANEEEVIKKMIANAYSLILSRLYSKKFEPIFPGYFTIRHKTTGLERHYRINVVPDFVKLSVADNLPAVSLEQVTQLYQKPFEQSEWLELLPPEYFEFKGILIIFLTEVTQQETKARIKNRLLGKESSQPELDIPYLRTQVRSFFRMPDLQIGFQQHQHLLRQIMSAYGALPGLLNKVVSLEAFEQSGYGQVKENREPVIIEDLQKMENRGEVEETLLANGIRSLMLIPILHQDGKEIGGILELGSSEPGALHHLHLTRIRGLLPIFSAGLDRKREEMDNRLRQIIQQQFTNIHSSVQWKFTEVSLDLLRKQLSDRDRQHKMAPLIFKQVFPLYGQADIISSSANRNRAILSDLRLNLETLSQLLTGLAGQKPAYLLDYFQNKVGKIISELEQSFSPSDETRVLNLLKLDIHPYLKELGEASAPELRAHIGDYFRQLHQPLDVMYNQRKAFEESVAMLNEAISKLIQEEDDRMQSTLPHYFEKYKTDGVEYNIYLGQSLLQKETFSENSLREFRLWQLILMARITRLVQDMQERLPMPLQTSQLIFVYSDPLDIRFRLDEKRFDVDGAYNVRYEILKKRIDKALIEGTKERLTQQGKIAIVYLHSDNRREYREYLDYLAQKGFIEPEVEEFSLAKMQGVEGLRALRVTVWG